MAGRTKLGILSKTTQPEDLQQAPKIDQAPSPEEIDLVELLNNTELDGGLLQTSGVGLTPGEFTAVNSIAAKLNITRNKLLRLAIRRLILDVKNNRLDLLNELIEPPQPEKRPKNKIKLPTE